MNTVQVPLPPDELMIAVSGHARHADFERSRLAGPEQLLADLLAAGVDLSRIKDALDFGCGCGRFLAGWLIRGIGFRAHGCDYNPLLVQWCNENLPGIEVKENALGEPLPYASNSFDLVYLLSVFTHLDLPEQKRLAGEFRRLLKPGGYLYVTFHGEHFHPRMFREDPTAEAALRTDGFAIGGREREGENDCWTLHTLDRLAEICSGFTLLKHFKSIERGPTDIAAWQDSAVFRKRRTSLGWIFR
jgi:SAM-dependent methyltransferase